LQGNSAVGRIRSTEKSSDLIRNRTRDHPGFSIVPQPTTLPRARPPSPTTLRVGKEASRSHRNANVSAFRRKAVPVLKMSAYL
jgi:hypothetical protein